jgi:hypothetical protein
MNILYDIQNVVVLVLTAMDPLSSPRPAFDSIVMVKDMPASPLGGITKPLVNIYLSIRKPELVFEPASLTKNVVRGTQKLLDIKVTNIGDVSARDVTINLPSDAKISLVSDSGFVFFIARLKCIESFAGSCCKNG